MQDTAQARWDDVRVFLAALRYRSFGISARRLGIDTSTVSRRISAFEDSLGVRLFERSRDGLVPTRAAELVVAAAEVMEAAHARIAREVADRDTVAEGVVRISADPGVAEVFVVPLLPRLRERQPLIDIELDASPHALDLTRHEADLAVRAAPVRGAQLVVTKLATARWAVAAGPELAARLGRVRAWNDLTWITWDRESATFEPAAWIARHAGKARIALRTSSFACQLAAAGAGLGVGLFPRPFIRAKGLREVRLSASLAAATSAWPTTDVWLACHRVLRDVPRVAAVWAFLADELRPILAQ